MRWYVVCATAFIGTASLCAAPVVFCQDLELVSGGYLDGRSQSTAHSAYPLGIDDTGRHVLFLSNASNLVPGDTNLDFEDLFVRDTISGKSERITVSTAGVQANRDTDWAAMSPDGRYVAFTSYATNLVPPIVDDNITSDVFLRDRQAGTTELVSVAPDGGVPSDSSIVQPGAVSPDGRYVLFVSGAPEFPVRGLLVRDRLNKTTTGFLPGRLQLAGCGNPRLSYDWRFVALECGARLVAADQNDDIDIYVFDRQTGAVELASRGIDGKAANTNCWLHDISPDGKFVVWFSRASNLVVGDTNNRNDVFVRDRASGRVERVSVSSTERQLTNDSYGSTISADGRYVVFMTSAYGAVPKDTNNAPDVFVRDRLMGTTTRWSVGVDGSQANGEFGVLSRDGHSVAFVSYASNLLPEDTNVWADVYVKRAVAQGLVIEPSLLSFGIVKVGMTSAVKTVVIKNADTSARSISWIGVRGTDASQFQRIRKCPAVLAAGASCSADVTFAPTSSGDKVARLVVSEGFDKPRYEARLRGTGSL